MKNLIIFCVALIGLTRFGNAQISKWLNYTSGKEITALTNDGNNMWVGTYGSGLV
jgi:hypothetical protein